jgi:hypothetical protein
VSKLATKDFIFVQTHAGISIMLGELYPKNLQEWVALTGVLIPFIALAGGAVWRAWTYHREQKQKEWERLHELLKTLYNKDGDYGEWAQLAAVYEMKTVRIDQSALADIVSNVLEYWSKSGGSAPALTTELRRLLTSLPRGRSS